MAIFRLFFFHLALFGLLISSFSASWIVVDHHVNLEEVIENFCVNKEKPRMACNGQCHLAKQLRQDEKRQDQLPQIEDNRIQGQWNTSPQRLDFLLVAISTDAIRLNAMPSHPGFGRLPDHPPSC